MAKDNGKVPGTFVSQKELSDLSALLNTFRDYIISHEARIEAVEEWINEFIKAQTNPPTEEATPDSWEDEGGAVLDEPTDNSSEGQSGEEGVPS